MAEFIPKNLCHEIIGRLCRKYDAPSGLAKELSDTVDRQPASDVKVVRHAWWDNSVESVGLDSMFYKCSKCGYTVYGGNGKTPYCCKCGAKMDGKDKDNESN